MITRDKSFYKNFFSLMAILAIQNMIVLSVNLIDNLMIGNYSEDALAGVATVNQIQFIFQQVLMGSGDALVVMGSQYWGQSRTTPIKRLFCGGLILTLSAGIILFTLASFIPEQMVSIFTTDPEHIRYGAEYISIMRFTYLIFPISSILLSSLKSVETVKIAFFTSVISLIVNASINYTLIYGNFGFPQMGVTGAGIGTLIARIVELAIILLYVFKIDKKLTYKPRDFITFDKALLLDYFKNSVSFVVVAVLFGLSTALQTVILGHIDLTNVSGDPIAANSISSTMYMMLKVAAIGASNAAAIIIGKTVGQNKIDKVKEYSKTLQIVFLIIGVLTSITLYSIRSPILSLYGKITPETYELANNFILVLCITCIGTSYQMPVMTGVIRGGGDSAFVLKNDLVSIWGIMLPVSFIAAFVLKLHPVIIVFCLNSDQIFKCGAACVKVNRFNWIRKLTKPDTTQNEQTEQLS
ncbi:MAG: MATE family efflux transporter [Clostridiales bacterium]|nr:MATE family efflux transporter [Clostridiales bacterium]